MSSATPVGDLSVPRPYYSFTLYKKNMKEQKMPSRRRKFELVSAKETPCQLNDWG